MRKDLGVDVIPGSWDRKRGSLAGRAIDFIRKQCILPESRTLMELHPYQIDLIQQWCDPKLKAHVTVIAAGSAKTTTLAAFATACLYLTDEASIPVVADTVHQAWLTSLGKIQRFVELNPELDTRAAILEGQGSRQGVYVPYHNGRAFAVADRPAGLQGLNPGPIAVLEEMSEASIATFGAMLNRLGKRAEGKVVGISTPSFLEDNALLQVQRRAESGDPMPGVRLTQFISPQQDHRDESMWHLANPGLPFNIPRIEALRTDLAVLPEQRFRCYRLCQLPTGAESCWLNSQDDEGETGDGYETWQKLTSSFRFQADAPTWIGVDVAKSYDHAAVVRGQFRPDGRLHAKCRIWTPTDTATIDLEEIADHLREQCQRYDVQAVWYDPNYFYNAPALTREFSEEVMIAVPQTDARMAPLVGHAYASIRQARVSHDEDEAFTRHMLAGKRKICSRGYTIEKRHYANKCDGAVAFVMMHGAALNLGEPEEVDATSEMLGVN